MSLRARFASPSLLTSLFSAALVIGVGACSDDSGSSGDGGSAASTGATAATSTTTSVTSSTASAGSTTSTATGGDGGAGGQGATGPGTGSGGAGAGGGSTGTGPGAGGGSTVCEPAQPVPIEPEACSACSEDRCCGQLLDCASEEHCVALRTCFAGCGGIDCRLACYEEHLDGVGEDGVLRACTQAECWADCGLPEIASCGPMATGDDPCNVCTRAQCCDEAYALGQVPEIYEAAACESLCDGGACEDACFEQYWPALEDAYGELTACQDASCTAECGG